MSKETNRLAMYIICCHVDKPMEEGDLKSKYNIPLQAGAALTDKRICDLNDYDGFDDSISDRNKRYSEMTAMYWIGKHINTEYVGVGHYRRRFLLSDSELDKYMDKGFDIISSILIKLGCNPLEVDSYGDNALHQAAAGNHYDTFKLFMGLGIDLDYKNSRSHKAIDLTTNKKIEELINKALKAKECCLCHRIFDFDNKRYLCSIKEDIICKGCSRIDYYFPTEEAEEKDIRDCRCKECQDEIIKAENDLQNAIDSNNLEQLVNQFTESKKYKIDLHLKKLATLNEDRLRREKYIRELLDSLKVVEDHKTILKKVDELDKKLKDAEDHNVKLDPNLITRAAVEKKRLLAEKDLRALLSNIDITMASEENLKVLTELVDIADESKVAEEYVSKGKDLKEKYTLNLDAKNIMQKFRDYPIREYPEVEVVDPKKKSKL